MFRDMGGLSQAVSLADKLAVLSEQGATKAGERATDLQKAVLKTFEDVIKDDTIGKAVVSEFMLPGSGASVLQGAQSKKSKEKTGVAPDGGGDKGKSQSTPQ
jgi:4-diphosphocytidyl-2C-methyl-D-erythritol kinase